MTYRFRRCLHLWAFFTVDRKADGVVRVSFWRCVGCGKRGAFSAEEMANS